MFTGIIESLGEVAKVEKTGGDARMLFTAADGYLKDVGLGDSVAVNGCCLTVVRHEAGGFWADLSAETLNLTTSAGWQPGLRVNLEKALTAGKALGGHIVSGHVDGVGKLLSRAEDARSIRMVFDSGPEIARYIAKKGSICIDGISLTVNEVHGSTFGVNIIPHTAQHTTLGDRKAGDAVNLEVDVMARYLERFLSVKEES